MNWTVRAAILLSAAFQLLHRWDGWISDDTLSYLSLARSMAEGPTASWVSAYWSPVYPALIAAVAQVFPHSLEDGLFTLRILSAILFVLQWLAFEFFVGGFEKSHSKPHPNLRWIASVLFLGSLWRWLPVQTPTPDPLVAVVAFIVGGLLLRQNPRAAPTSSGSFASGARLGGVLTIGYLCKTVLLPIAGATLLALSFRNRKVAASATAVLLLLSAPWVLAISAQQGRFTIGESGRLAYLWEVSACRNRIPKFRNWIGGECEGSGWPVHPVKLLLRQPRVYAFNRAAPTGTGLENSTFPTWLDPAYSWRGVKVPFSAANQIEVLWKNFRFTWIRCLAFAFSLMVLGCGFLPGFVQKWRNSTDRGIGIPLLAMTGAAVAAYGVGVNLETAFAPTRYLAPFWLMTSTLGLRRWLCASEMEPSRSAASVRPVFCWIIAGVFAAFVGRNWDIDPGLRQPSADNAPEARIAEQLARAGVRTGDGIAVFETDTVYPRMAAFLQRWSILATLDNSSILQRDRGPHELHTLDLVLANEGVKVWVGTVDPVHLPAGWTRIEGTEFGFRIIPEVSH